MSSEDYDKYSSSSDILFYASIAHLINGIIFMIIFVYNRCFYSKTIVRRDNIDDSKRKQQGLIKKVGVSKTFKSEGAKNIPITITVPSLASSSVISVDPIIETNRPLADQNTFSTQTLVASPTLTVASIATSVPVNLISDIPAKKTMDLKSNKNVQLIKSKTTKQRIDLSPDISKDKQPMKTKTLKKWV